MRDANGRNRPSSCIPGDGYTSVNRPLPDTSPDHSAPRFRKLSRGQRFGWAPGELKARATLVTVCLAVLAVVLGPVACARPAKKVTAPLADPGGDAPVATVVVPPRSFSCKLVVLNGKDGDWCLPSDGGESRRLTSDERTSLSLMDFGSVGGAK